jgi:hypothetical protein
MLYRLWLITVIAMSGAAGCAGQSGWANGRCIPSQPIQSAAPQNGDGGPAGPEMSAWFVNDDRTIWMLDRARTAGEPLKTAWFRPQGADLNIAGRRLGAAAPPLVVEVSRGSAYPQRFMPSLMTFPTEGCWEITATANDQTARFVVKVQPRRS